MNNVTNIGDAKMQQTKYTELKNMIGLLNHKVTTQHRLGQSMLVLLKNFSAQIEAMKDLLVTKAVFTEQDFNNLVDEKLGLKLRAEGEKIEVGDTVWVVYKGQFEGETEVFGEELPLRFGANAVIFEKALMGKAVGDKGVEYEAVWNEEGARKGKKVKFTIDIIKAKVRLVTDDLEEQLEGGSNDGDGRTNDNGESAGVEGQSQPDAQT